MLSLHGRVALITGGGTGIGAATARHFADAGAQVCVCGRRSGPLEELVAQLGGAGHEALAIQGDVRDPKVARHVVEEAAARWGRLDVLVNNAAHYVPAPAQDTGLDDWQQHFDTNVTAPFVLCGAARPPLIASGSGVVVNVLSTLASRPVAGTAAYSASKAALLSLTQTLALEWAADGIRVVAVSPGVVDTPVHSRQHLEQLARAHPLGRVGNTDEIAQAILFLASPASAWSTGTVLVVDGGISLA